MESQRWKARGAALVCVPRNRSSDDTFPYAKLGQQRLFGRQKVKITEGTA